MGETAMYEYWNENYKTYNIEWTKDKARAVLEAWHRKFTEVCIFGGTVSGALKHHFAMNTVMFLSFWTDRSGQTVWSGSTLFAILSASFGCIPLW